MRNVPVLVLLWSFSVALAATAECRAAAPVDGHAELSTSPPPGIRLFDLHDPASMRTWPGFLATTPMLNNELLSQPLQDRLINVVEIYRSVTPVDQPAFFVATYFDLLSDRLLAGDTGTDGGLRPLQVCPVFASGNAASVSSLLALASGLPDELFRNAPGEPERYRYLFLQTEFSHCRFLAGLRASEAAGQPVENERHPGTATVRLLFSVNARSYTAMVGTEEELRALLETVGEVDAITSFRQQVRGSVTRDEADVLSFIRLLSLLATDGESGYAGIPVLYPMLNESGNDGPAAGRKPLRISDALALAYEARKAFRRIVPSAIRDTDDLLQAKLAVMRALAEGRGHPADDGVAPFLAGFVTGTDLLLAPTIAQEKMPLFSE